MFFIDNYDLDGLNNYYFGYVEQERVVAMLENISTSARDIDYRVLDELNSEDNDHSSNLKAFLNSLEMLS